MGRRCPRTPFPGSPTESLRTCRPGPPGRCRRSTRRSSSTPSTSRSPDSTDGQVGNQPFYAAIAVDLDGHRDVLGLWAGHGGGESAKFWMSVLTDLRNRGVRDVFFVVCDGLKGLPDSVNAVFPMAIVQACVIHLIRATLRYASRKYWDQLARDLKPIYTAPTQEAAWAAFEELEEKWGNPYPA